MTTADYSYMFQAASTIIKVNYPDFPSNIIGIGRGLEEKVRAQRSQIAAGALFAYLAKGYEIKRKEK